MKNKRRLLISIIGMRCPRCREGKMYPYAMYSRRFMEMFKKCPCCGQSFVLEPGFFLGSAFFSYFINAVLMLAIAVGFYYSGRTITLAAMIVSTVIVVFGLLPVTLRLSKSIWIHIFVRYEGPCGEIPKKD